MKVDLFKKVDTKTLLLSLMKGPSVVNKKDIKKVPLMKVSKKDLKRFTA